MAPKKNQKPNAFIMFTWEWKKKYGKNLSMQQAIVEADKIWTKMNAEERQPYQILARGEKQQGGTDEARFTCHGVPISRIETEKKETELKEDLIKRNIEQTVRQSVKHGELEHQKYYFIMINYFAQAFNNGSYIPAELGLCEFSLKLGVTRLYHTLINPNIRIYGMQYDAQSFSEATHNLPLPPNALGETNMSTIYNSVLNFLKQSNDENCADVKQKCPVVYTTRDYIPMVESCLEFLQADVGACNFKLDVYPIQYLFYIMKLATCEQGEIKNIPTNVYVTDVQFAIDAFEYQTGIACDFHEKIDKVKYCAQSAVTRWGYMFADYMCQDIAIQMIPGRHVPENTRLDAIITPAPSNMTYSDAASFVSMQTSASDSTTALGGYNKFIYDDDDGSANKNGNKMGVVLRRPERKTNDVEFPPLGGNNSRKQHDRKVCQISSTASQRHETASSSNEIYKKYNNANADTYADRNYNATSSRIDSGLRNTPSVYSRFSYNEYSEADEDIDVNSYHSQSNPWSTRSKQKPREPSPSDYSVHSTRTNTCTTSSSGSGRPIRKK